MSTFIATYSGDWTSFYITLNITAKSANSYSIEDAMLLSQKKNSTDLY